MEKNQVMQALNCNVNADFNLQTGNMFGLSKDKLDHVAGDFHNYSAGDYSCWDYWKNDYYPTVIHHSYPVYLQERAKDKGKQAFEIIKILKDKKLVNIEKVSNFIDLMDELIKIL